LLDREGYECVHVGESYVVG